MNEDDAALVEAFRGGDREAFAALVLRHRQRAVDVARAMLGDAASADDVAQEATYQAFFEIESLRQPERFGAWLSGLAVNLSKMELRRQRAAVSLDNVTGGGYVPEALVARTTTPEREYEILELRRRVQQALGALSEDMRAAVWLHYVEGMTYQEVSAMTGIAASRLRVLSHRARERLRRELAGEWRSSRRRTGMAELIEVTVDDVQVRVPKDRPPDGPVRGNWTVILKSKSDDKLLRIWVPPMEGQYVAEQISGAEEPPRPQTYRFITKLLDGLGARVERAVVTDLVDDVFIAYLDLRSARKTPRVDARPSDALNVALRAGAPIFVAETVMSKAAFSPFGVSQSGLAPSEERMLSRRFAVEDGEHEWIAGADVVEQAARGRRAFFQRLSAERKQSDPRAGVG